MTDLATISELQGGPFNFVASSISSIGTSVVVNEGQSVYVKENGRVYRGNGRTTWGTYTSSMGPAARVQGGRSWLFIGDSITHGANVTFGSHFPYTVTRLLGTSRVANLPQITVLAAAMPPVAYMSAERGNPGENSSEILARFDRELATGTFKGVSLLCGANDAGQAVPIATFQSNLNRMAEKCKVAGIPLVVGTVPPQRSPQVTTERRKAINAMNLWIQQWGPKNDIPVAQVHKALVDEATGDLAVAYDSDGIHPNLAGHNLIAQAFATAIATITPPVQHLIYSSGVGVSTNSLMANAGGGPTGWTGSSTGTTTCTFLPVAKSGALTAGVWAQMDVTGTGGTGGTRSLTRSHAGITSGGLCAVVAQVEVEDVTGYTASEALGTSGWGIRCITNSGTVFYAFASGTLAANLPVSPVFVAFRLAAGITAVNVEMSGTVALGVQAKFRFGCVDVIDLDALSLDLSV